MNKRILLAISALALGLGNGAAAADLPKATQKALQKLKLDDSILKGLDKELDVPKAWVDAAGKEGEVVILGTWSNKSFPKMTQPFRERYPNIKLNYHRARTSERGIKVVVALKEGRVVADVLTSIADAYFQFEKLHAFADLRELPSYKSVPKEYASANGEWMSYKLSFRCMAYNTNNVKKEDLPKEWSDLLTNPVWRGGKLAVSNHPNAWMLPLWGVWGEKKGAAFLKGLFDKVQPQLRKEGMTATTSLTVAGEFNANIPAPEWRVKQWVNKGAPVGYHCPSPVPMTLSQIVMLQKAPHKNAARVFINWMMSAEGQLLQYADSYAVPANRALQSDKFIPFIDTIKGKPVAIRDDSVLGNQMHKNMLKMWNGYWGGSGGKK